MNRSVFDIGAQTSTALNRLVVGCPPNPVVRAKSGTTETAHSCEYCRSRFGIGAMIRELMELAARQSLPTHGHPRAQVACALYCLWARAVLQEAADPCSSAVNRLRSHGGFELFAKLEIQRVLDPFNSEAARGSGYAADTLWSAKAAVEAPRTSRPACAVQLHWGTTQTRPQQFQGHRGAAIQRGSNP